MKIANKNMILHTVQDHNVLPITSSCNTSCIFCSHRFNPQDLDVYRLPKLDLDDIKDMISFLNKGRKIIIGESATRIIEGEPLVRKDILEILKIVRHQFQEEVILITTNGIGLNEEKVTELKKLNPVEINVSLNSSSEYGRKTLLGDKTPSAALKGIKLLDKYGLSFHGSIVAMPMVIGYEDIYDTISFLDAYNSKTIRIFVPGFAKTSSIKFDFNETRMELYNFIKDIQDRFKAPIILEPPVISNLAPIVEGVIYKSKAYKLGIKSGDIIYKVNDKEFNTRVDCFNYIYKSKDPVLRIKRKDREFEIMLSKDQNVSSGIVMLYDVSMELKKDISRMIDRNKANKTLILVSELGEAVMKSLLYEEIRENKLVVKTVNNQFFGGTIKSAGLLVVDDFINEIEEIKKDIRPDLIIIPSKSFDFKGKDLMGKSCYDIEEIIKIKTEIL